MNADIDEDDFLYGEGTQATQQIAPAAAQPRPDQEMRDGSEGEVDDEEDDEEEEDDSVVSLPLLVYSL